MAGKSPTVASNRSHLRFVSRYLQRYKHTNYSLGEWRRYKDGVWEQVADLAIKKECMQICAQHAEGLPITSAVVNSVYQMLQAHVFLADDTFDSNIDLITFTDKTLVVSTGQIRNHSPSDYVTTKLPFKYDPEARSEAWEKVLTATDSDYIPFLQAFSGYSLTPSTAHEIGVW